jgi:hypothetical protein
MKKIICLLFFIPVLFSCEKNVTIKIPEKEPSLVVDARMKEGDIIELAVSKSRYILKPLENPNSYPESYVVTNAVVVVYENGIAIDTLVYNPMDFIYRSKDSLTIRAGYRYSIKVTAPGFKEVTSESIVPSQSEIADVKRVRHARVNSDGSDVDEITIKLDDPAETNFYLIKFYGASYNNQYNYTLGCVGTSDKDIEAIGDDGGPLEEDNCRAGGNLLMKDLNFNGRQKQVKFSIVSNQLNEITVNGVTYRPYVTVLRITEDYFKYAKSLATYQNLHDNPFGEPVNVYTNVKNGYGIFTAYTAAAATLP